MTARRLNRALARNRHGRPIRRPLQSPRLAAGTIRIGDFGQHVEDTFYFLKMEFPGEFDHIAIRVRDLPSLRADAKSVKWAWSASHNLLTFYRVPMTYSGRRRDPVDEYLRVDWEIIKALASVTGKDPKNIWDGPAN